MMKILSAFALSLCAVILAALLTACGEERTPAQKLLDQAAAALENKDAQKFLACIDLNAYAANQLKNLSHNDDILGSLNKLGNTLGLGNVDQLIGSLVDLKGTIQRELDLGVSSGQIMAECKTATTPDCPWWPEAMKKAEIIEVNPNAAIARVTTPANITSWLVLRKNGAVWQIAGRAILESTAREYAAEPASRPASDEAHI